jgi:iron complex outermembrane receptor protein
MTTCRELGFEHLAAVAGASVLAASAPAALAQTAPQSASQNAPAQVTAVPEVIVTAQRRSERLQDVPVAISVQSGEALSKSSATNIRDLQSVVSGIVMGGGGPQLSPAIRGVSSTQSDPGNDSNVSLYVDGVYENSQMANTADLVDISRVEVLKGPQGTLFGRNATGGAIRVFTREPNLNAVAGTFNVGFGNYAARTVDGFVSAPIVSDRLAISLSGHYSQINGYDYDLIRHTDTDPSGDKTFRAKVLFQATDNLKLELFGSYLYHRDNDATAYDALNGNSAGRLFGATVIASQPYTYVSQAPAEFKSQLYNAGFRAVWDTSLGQITSLSATSAERGYYSNDADFSNVDVLSYPVHTSSNNFQQEVDFASKKFGQFQFTGGANYYGDSSAYSPVVLEGDFITFGYGVPAVYGYLRQRTDAYGVFGEVTWQPTDRLTILGGLRYSSETRKAFQAAGVPGGYKPTPGVPDQYAPVAPPVTFTAATPRASIRYRLTDRDDNVYFTYSQGFKSGGFNTGGDQASPFKPEKLSSYEIGLKTSPSRMISGNVAAFYYDYTNQQVIVLVNNTNFTSNAASSRIYGVDGDFTLRLTPEFTVTSSLSYLDAKFRKYINVPVNLPTGGAVCECGNTPVITDLSGGPEPFSPKFTASVVAAYKKELPIGVASLTASFYHTDRFDFEPSPRLFQGAYDTLGLRAEFSPQGSKLTLYAWGKNVTNTRYIVNILDSAAGDGVRYARPATWGGGARYEF